MSKRYGRNQKRRHLAEIARLEQALHLTITSGFAPATGNPMKMQLDDLIGVPIAVDITDMEDGFTIRREAKIRFVADSPDSVKKLTYAACYSGIVEWRGIVWQVLVPSFYEPSAGFCEMEVMEIELRALGDRHSQRQPFARPNHRDVRRHTSGLVAFCQKQMESQPA